MGCFKVCWGAYILNHDDRFESKYQQRHCGRDFQNVQNLSFKIDACRRCPVVDINSGNFNAWPRGLIHVQGMNFMACSRSVKRAAPTRMLTTTACYIHNFPPNPLNLSPQHLPLNPLHVLHTHPTSPPKILQPPLPPLPATFKPPPLPLQTPPRNLTIKLNIINQRLQPIVVPLRPNIPQNQEIQRPPVEIRGEVVEDVDFYGAGRVVVEGVVAYA